MLSGPSTTHTVVRNQCNGITDSSSRTSIDIRFAIISSLALIESGSALIGQHATTTNFEASIRWFVQVALPLGLWFCIRVLSSLQLRVYLKRRTSYDAATA